MFGGAYVNSPFALNWQEYGLSLPCLFLWESLHAVYMRNLFGNKRISTGFHNNGNEIMKNHQQTSLPWFAMWGVFLAFVALAFTASGAEAAVAVEGRVANDKYIFNTFFLLICGVLIMWMCAGFTMLESGSVRTKNASVICLKNIGLYAIAGIMFYIIGYNLMFVDVGGWIGSVKLLFRPSGDEVALLAGNEKAGTAIIGTDYASISFWFFQMTFVATTASIVSGALAERVKLWTFFVFIAILTGIIYPLVGAWTWGGGWLTKLGFSDFAGSTIVHSTGGWAALAGVIVVGARRGKFREDGSVKPTPPSNVPLVTLGAFILWFGWFGFNGGSMLVLKGSVDALTMSNVLVSTNLAAAAGCVAVLFTANSIFGRVDLLAVLNGAIGGLVAITAGPNIVEYHWAVIIGAIGGLVCAYGLKILENLKIDDVVGAIPAHLFAGIWGTLAVCIAAGGSLSAQIIGIVAIGLFVFVISYVVWLVLDKTMGVRVTASAEDHGQDSAELGIEAYPEFVLMPDEDDAHLAKGTR